MDRERGRGENSYVRGQASQKKAWLEPLSLYLLERRESLVISGYQSKDHGQTISTITLFLVIDDHNMV